MHLDADNTQGKKWQKGMLGDKMVGYVGKESISKDIESQQDPIKHVMSKYNYQSDVMILKGCIFNTIECNYVDGLELKKEVL